MNSTAATDLITVALLLNPRSRKSTSREVRSLEPAYLSSLFQIPSTKHSRPPGCVYVCVCVSVCVCVCEHTYACVLSESIHLLSATFPL